MSARPLLFALLGACLVPTSGCGSRAPETVLPTTTAAEAGANQRFQAPPGSEQIIGKNAQVLWKPGMKQPPSAKPSAPAQP